MKHLALPCLDKNRQLREYLRRYCRLEPGQVWQDPAGGHRVGCGDCASPEDVRMLMAGDRAQLAIHDPPYNLAVFERRSVEEFIEWSSRWIDTTQSVLAEDASLYIWLGADQQVGFSPLADFMILMRGKEAFASRSFITMRNQRGYGTQKNWMAVRQELLYYTKGSPTFHPEAVYTDIPKILRGYYKEVRGEVQENQARGLGQTIRAGNVWVDIQQVFYRMQENVSGCYAQKPLKCIDRIIEASSDAGGIVIDFFGHSGTTLLASEISNRICFTMDVDPVYCEIMIRRLEKYRENGLTGWQNSNAFEAEIEQDETLAEMLEGNLKQTREIAGNLV